AAPPAGGDLRRRPPPGPRGAHRRRGGAPGRGLREVRGLHPSHAGRRGALQAPRAAIDPRGARLSQCAGPLDRDPRAARRGPSPLAGAGLARPRRDSGGHLDPDGLVSSSSTGGSGALTRRGAAPEIRRRLGARFALPAGAGLGLRPELFPLALQLSVNLIRNADGGTLTAEAKIVHRGRTTLVVDVEVFDDQRRLIAKLAATQLAPAAPPAETRPHTG